VNASGTFLMDCREWVAQAVPSFAQLFQDKPFSKPEINPALRQSPLPDTLIISRGDNCGGG